MKVAIVGDSFTDKYYIGEVSRISPEAPIPILDVFKKEQRPGGALNVANNLFHLGITPTVFTITNFKMPFPIITPSNCTPLVKTRFVSQKQQLLRVDNPKKYRRQDVEKIIFPTFDEFNIIAFVDYNKGVVKGGKATIVDSKKKDLSVFQGTEYLKINKKEWQRAKNKTFPKAFITKGEEGIDYYENGVFITSKKNTAKEIIDITGAGDTVMAVILFCLVKGIKDPVEVMRLSNKAASIVISKFGASSVTLRDLNL